MPTRIHFDCTSCSHRLHFENVFTSIQLRCPFEFRQNSDSTSVLFRCHSSLISNHLDDTLISLRCHLVSTSVSLRSKTDLSSISLRAHFGVISMSLRSQADFNAVPLRIRFGIPSGPLRCHFGFASISLRFNFEITELSL